MEEAITMDKIYTVEGVVNRGFVGQISYIVCLDKKYDTLDIEFEFDKQRVSTITEEIKMDLLNTIVEDDSNSIDKDHLDQYILTKMKRLKTEIQLSAFLNDTFIGGIHKQLSKRNLMISQREASEGGIPQSNIEGVLKLNIIVFNVLYDNTHYKLTVRGK